VQGIVTREEVYDRAKYFLEGVIPTAEKFNVQMACHLNDPPAPVLRGVEQVKRERERERERESNASPGLFWLPTFLRPVLVPSLSWQITLFVSRGAPRGVP
jgi:hypothetical protein